jgi:hypothetical protein
MESFSLEFLGEFFYIFFILIKNSKWALVGRFLSCSPPSRSLS